jgi:GDPmannose 4,6-dehydratase
MSKVALITGITGQDGSYLAELLIKKNYKVHGIIRKKYNNKNLDYFYRIAKIIKKLKLHYLPYHGINSIKKIIKKTYPDEVYHLAAQAYDVYSFNNEFYTIDTNLNYTHRILSATKEVNPKANFFFAGSSEMYSKNIKTKIDENTKFNPSSAYGISKVAGYHLVKSYRENYNFNSSTGILFNHESPRKDKQFVLKKIALSVAKIKYGLQKNIKLGDIKSKRDWGHAKDFVKAIWLINTQNKASDFVVGTGELHSVEEFAKKAFEFVGLNYKKYLIIDRKLIRQKDSKARKANPKKIINKLKWKKKFNFNKLVFDMVKYELNRIKKKNHVFKK